MATGMGDLLIGRMRKRLERPGGVPGALLDAACSNAGDFDALAGELAAPDLLGALVDGFWGMDAELLSSVRTAKALRRREDPVRRVAMFYRTLGTGGAERVTIDTALLWRSMGLDVLLLCDEGQAGGFDAEAEGVALRELPDCLSTNPGQVRRRCAALHDALATFGADALVCCQWLGPNIAWDLLAAKAAGAAFIVFTHGTTRVLTGYDNPAYMRLPAIYGCADAVVCLGEEDARFWRTFSRVVRTAVNRVEPPFAAADGPRLDGHRICWVGRVSHDKAPLEMLDVLRRVVDEVGDATLVVAGPFGDCPRKEYMRRIDELGLDGHVELLGDVAHGDLPGVLAGCDAFAMTSRMEGYPVALAEAKAMGLPCAMFDLPYVTLLGRSADAGPGMGGDVDEATERGGVLVAPVGDVDALASQIVRILVDKGLASRLGEAARAHALGLQGFDLAALWAGIFGSADDAMARPAMPGAEVASTLLEAGRRLAEERRRAEGLDGALSAARMEADAASRAADEMRRREAAILGDAVARAGDRAREEALGELRGSASYRLGHALLQPARGAMGVARRIGGALGPREAK